MNATDVISLVSRTHKTYSVSFPPAKPKVKDYNAKYVSAKSIIRPDFNIYPTDIGQADFYISSARVDFTLNNSLENNSWRNIRRGSDSHYINLENYDMGRHNTYLPRTPRHGSSGFTVKVSQHGALTMIKDLLEAFLTGWVSGKFNIDATACALLLCMHKVFDVKAVLPVRKVNVHW